MSSPALSFIEGVWPLFCHMTMPLLRNNQCKSCPDGPFKHRTNIKLIIRSFARVILPNKHCLSTVFQMKYLIKIIANDGLACGVNNLYRAKLSYISQRILAERSRNSTHQVRLLSFRMTYCTIVVVVVALNISRVKLWKGIYDGCLFSDMHIPQRDHSQSCVNTTAQTTYFI